jgi:hypothetical protein
LTTDVLAEFMVPNPAPRVGQAELFFSMSHSKGSERLRRPTGTSSIEGYVYFSTGAEIVFKTAS